MATVKKKPAVEAKVPSEGRVSLEWSDAHHPGIEWLSTTIPEGERSPARIKISSRNSDGSYSYFCYRDAHAVRVVHDLKAAMAACEVGRAGKISASVLNYVTEHPGELPPFLALTDAERRAIRGQYPYAAPKPALMARAAEPGVPRAAGGGMAKAGGAGTVSGAPKAARAAPAAVPAGTLERLRDGNPKRPGTGAYKRWQALFEACERGDSVAEYEKAGHNMETLANAISKKYVRVKEA